MSKKVGVFGGSFDPVHLGHTNYAQEVQAQLHFDEILVIPTLVSPFKVSSPPQASAVQRFEMLKIAFEDIPFCRISDVEIKRGGVSYTYLTVADLIAKNPDTDYTLLLRGNDFPTFDRWVEVEKIRSQVDVLFATEGEFLDERSVDDQWIRVSLLPYSSTMVREKLKAKEMPEEMLNPKVLDYIMKHELYFRP